MKRRQTTSPTVADVIAASRALADKTVPELAALVRSQSVTLEVAYQVMADRLRATGSIDLPAKDPQ
jgi:hypothetical protein